MQDHALCVGVVSCGLGGQKCIYTPYIRIFFGSALLLFLSCVGGYCATSVVTLLKR